MLPSPFTTVATLSQKELLPPSLRRAQHHKFGKPLSPSTFNFPVTLSCTSVCTIYHLDNYSNPLLSVQSTLP